MDKIWHNHKALIHDRAWSWARKTGLPRDDFLSVGNEVFVNCVLSYNREKGAFTTFLWKSLENRFQDLTKREFRYAKLTAEAAAALKAPEKHTFREKLKDLSPSAIWLAQEIFTGDAPLRMLEKQPNLISPAKTRGRIFQWLRDQGWSSRKIWATFSELRSVV